MKSILAFQSCPRNARRSWRAVYMFFFSSRRRHTRCGRDWSSDVCSSDLSLNFTEPWFLGRPWTLGFSIFKRQTDYSGFRKIGSGGTVSLGRLLGAFSRFDVAYGFENVDLLTTTPGFPVNRRNSATSSVTSLYTVDTRNNFFRPTRGYRVQGSMEYAGGVLGGDNFFYKPRLDR